MKAKRVELAVSCISLAIALIALMPSAAYADSLDCSPIRVGITRLGSQLRQISVSSTSGVCITSTTTRLQYPAGSLVSLEAGADAILLTSSTEDGLGVGSSLTISPASPLDALTVQAGSSRAISYRGSFVVSLKARALRLVNVAPIEDYVLSVLPSEMPEGYPVEALKAQAIAARTYALANRGKHKADGFEVCDCTHCQTYSGVVTGKPKCVQAAKETAGQVLLYDGLPARVMYSADGGGMTQNYAESYQVAPIPYLCGARDPEDVPHLAWEKLYTLDELGNRLVKAGVAGAAGLQSIRVTKTSSSGRALVVEIVGENGTATITGARLRTALGYDVIKSTLLTIEVQPDGMVAFKGKGWGHGIGLCQAGAKGLAQPPHAYTCAQILAHYFPGTTVALVSSPLAQPIATLPQPTARPRPDPEQAPAPVSQGRKIVVTAVAPAKTSPPKPELEVRLKAPDRL